MNFAQESGDFIQFEDGQVGEEQEEGMISPDTLQLNPNKRPLDKYAHSNPSKRSLPTTVDPLSFARLNEAPWVYGNSYSTDPVRRLHEEILDFVSYVSPSEAEHNARRTVINTISAIILSKYPTAKIEIFGSYDTKLYLPTADLDLVIFNDFKHRKVTNTLHRIADLLEREGIVVEGTMKRISKARIPILKFTDSTYHFDVDISFNINSGIESAAIMKALMDIIPSIKPLTLLIKQFLAIRNLNEVFHGGLGSYSITLLIVSFLQMHPLVQSKAIKPEDNYGVLLIEFFELYGRLFNYDTVGISLRDMGFYFDKVQRGWAFGEKMMLSLEDPQDPANDVAKSSFAMNSVKQAFEHSYLMLTSIIKELDYLYQSGKRMPKGDSFSILSSILHLEWDTVKHREFVNAKIKESSLPAGIHKTNKGHKRKDQVKLPSNQLL